MDLEMNLSVFPAMKARRRRSQGQVLTRSTIGKDNFHAFWTDF